MRNLPLLLCRFFVDGFWQFYLCLFVLDDSIKIASDMLQYGDIIKQCDIYKISQITRRSMMDKNAKIVIKKKLSVTDLSGEKVMVDFDAGKYFLIKGVGNDIWDMLQEEVTPNQIIEKLLSEYDVEREECESSVMEFLEKMKSYDFID